MLVGPRQHIDAMFLRLTMRCIWSCSVQLVYRYGLSTRWSARPITATTTFSSTARWWFTARNGSSAQYTGPSTASRTTWLSGLSSTTNAAVWLRWVDPLCEAAFVFVEIWHKNYTVTYRFFNLTPLVFLFRFLFFDRSRILFLSFSDDRVMS